MINFKNLIYPLACLSFSIVIGGAVYEHLAVIPQWSAGPPASLSMFQGEYGLNAAAFWSKIHLATLPLFITSLILFWKTSSRKNILIPFIGYLIVLVVTGIYFVPELIEISNTPYDKIINPELQSRAKLWENLSLIRLLFIIALALFLYLGLTKINKTRIVPA